MADPVDIISILIGAAGLLYALWENSKRKKIEDIVETNIDALEKSVELQGQRGRYAKENIDKLLNLVGSIPDEAKRNEAIKAAGYGRGDATSTQDLSVAIQGHLKALRMRKNKNV